MSTKIVPQNETCFHVFEWTEKMKRGPLTIIVQDRNGQCYKEWKRPMVEWGKIKLQLIQMLSVIPLQCIHRVNMECKVWKNLIFWRRKGPTKKKLKS